MCLEKYLCPYVKMAQMHSICSKFSHLVNVIDSNFGNFLIFHVQNSTCNGSVTCSGHIILRCMYIVHVNAPGQVNNLWSFFKCCVHVCLSSWEAASAIVYPWSATTLLLYATCCYEALFSRSSSKCSFLNLSVVIKFFKNSLPWCDLLVIENKITKTIIN